MAIDFAGARPVSNDPAALSAIRHPDTEAAAAFAASETRGFQPAAPAPAQNAAEMLDTVKQKIEANIDLTPEERAFYDQASKQIAGAPAAPPAAEAKPDPNVQQIEQIDAITTKLEKGEPLTAEEEKYLETVQGQPAIPDKTYKIGGQEFTSVQMVEKMAVDTGATVEELSTLSPAVLAKMVDNFATKLNKHEWSAAYTGRDQDLARQRRQVGAIATGLMNDAMKIQQDLQQAATTLQRIEALAATNVDSNSLYDEAGRIDLMKQREFNKVMDAREALPGLKQTITALQERSAQTEQKLSVQRFRDFQEAHPQYRMSFDIVEAAAMSQEGRLTGTDAHRLFEMVEILKAADAARIHPDDIYDYRKNARLLAIAPLANEGQKRETGLPRFDKGNPETQKLIDSLRLKRAAFQGAAGGGGVARPSVATKQQQAVGSIAAASRAAMGVAGPSSIMDESGY